MAVPLSDPDGDSIVCGVPEQATSVRAQIATNAKLEGLNITRNDTACYDGSLMLRTIMNTRQAVTTATALLMLASAAPASAQIGAAWIERGYFNLNVGFETSSGTLNDATTFRLYDETGTRTVEQNVDSGSFIDFSVGGRVWQNVSVGIGFHRGANSSEASGTASVPHPILFNTNRLVAVAADNLDRTEQAFHIQVGYMIPLNEDLSVHVTAGPSFFRLKQEVLADVAFTEVGAPFSAVNTSAVVAERSDSVVGVNAGVDVAYRFYESDAYNIGGGVFLRYAGGSARITVLENNVDTDVGGLQFGFGARVRF